MTATDRTEPVAVDTVVTGEWIITLNADRAIYRDGAIAVSGGVIVEVGKRAAILAKLTVTVTPTAAVSAIEARRPHRRSRVRASSRPAEVRTVTGTRR